MFESRVSNYQKARVMDVWKHRVDSENEDTGSETDHQPSWNTSKEDTFRLDIDF